MRIGIDGRALTGNFTGDRTYWRSLLHALLKRETDDTFVVYSRAPIDPSALPASPALSLQTVPAANDRVWTLLALPRALRRDQIDLVHVQYTAPPARLCPCPIVTTVHDISFRLFPQWFPARHRLLLNLTVPLAMRQAARVITDSESSRRDILRVYALPPAKIAAIPLGLPDGFSTPDPLPASATLQPALTMQAVQEIARGEANQRFGLDGPFFLAVGVLQPRKNLRLLAEAFGRARRAHGLPHRLVIVGKAGWGTEPDALRDAARRGGGTEAADALTFPGYVADDDLPILYRACDAFAYPSLYEGFGLPPLEAMACGAPVVVSDAPAMPEVVGDAALIVAAQDVEAWAAALARIVQDAPLRQALRERGLARVRQFTWQETAARTHAIYQAACNP